MHQLQQEVPTRPQRLVHLVQHPLVLGIALEVAQGRENVDDCIELVYERDLTHVVVDPRDRHSTRLCLGSSAIEEDLTQILAGDLVPPLGKWHGMPSMAAGEVKDAAALRQVEQVDDALHLTRSALVR